MADLEKKGRDAKPDPKKKKPKKPRRSLVRVVKDTVSEIKKVTWPTRKEWINHTVVVTVFVVIMMAIVGLIDLGLSTVFQLLFA